MMTAARGTDPVLDQLRAKYGCEWNIWRAEGLWVANARITGVEPTIVETSPAALEARLQAPDRSVGGLLGPVPM